MTSQPAGNHPNSAVVQPSPVMPGATRKKVNILAMGSSRADFDAVQLMEQRPDILVDAETWGINYMGAIKKLDRIIHVDPVHPYLGSGPVKDMCDNALKDGIPFYTSWPHPFYSNHVVFPFDKIVQGFGVHYINGSVSAALALAMSEGFTDIGLFGCDFSYPNAHVSESGRGCVEFWIGMGTQRGIRFVIAATSTLLDLYCKQQPYGFFADPMLPPSAGGKLMDVPQIMAHCQRMREPRMGQKPVIYSFQPTTPQNVEAAPTFTPEHLVPPTVPNWLQEPPRNVSALRPAAPGGTNANGADNDSDNLSVSRA